MTRLSLAAKCKDLNNTRRRETSIDLGLQGACTQHRAALKKQKLCDRTHAKLLPVQCREVVTRMTKYVEIVFL